MKKRTLNDKVVHKLNLLTMYRLGVPLKELHREYINYVERFISLPVFTREIKEMADAV